MSKRASILLSCGEASGDLYASELVRELSSRTVPEVFGLAGDRSRAAGAELLVHLDEISVIGLVEVVSKLPALRRAMDQLVAAAEERRPDVAVLVDFSGFNLRLARRLSAIDIPIIYFVSPQVWAWRRGRLAAIRELVDEMLVILPFEEAFYEREGVRVRYVGHPIVDLVKPSRGRAPFLGELGLDPERPVLLMLPGSRRREIELHLPVLKETMELLSARRPEIQFVVSRAPTVSRDVFLSAVGDAASRVKVLESDVYDGLAHADVAVVASGTATVEAALSGTPMVVVYRVGALSYAIGRAFVDVPHFSMVNLIAGRALVPELIQRDMTPGGIAAEVLSLLDDPERAAAMKRGLAEVKEKLGGGGASARAADAVASFLESRARRGEAP